MVAQKECGSCWIDGLQFRAGPLISDCSGMERSVSNVYHAQYIWNLCEILLQVYILVYCTQFSLAGLAPHTIEHLVWQSTQSEVFRVRVNPRDITSILASCRRILEYQNLGIRVVRTRTKFQAEYRGGIRFLSTKPLNFGIWFIIQTGRHTLNWTQGIIVWLRIIYYLRNTSGTWYLTLEGYQNAQDNIPLKAIIFYGILWFYLVRILHFA